MDLSGTAANPARGQLNRENEYFPVAFVPENLISRDGFGIPVSRHPAHLHVCVCVFFPSTLDIKFVGRTSRGHTGFLIHLLSAVRALIFLARRIQPFLSLVDREVEFCV